MYSKELVGKEVVGSNGWKIGKTKEVIFDKDSWRITHLDVQLKANIEQELGMGSAVPLQHYRLPVDVNYIQGIGDVITLNRTKEDLLGDIRAYANKTAATIPASPSS